MSDQFIAILQRLGGQPIPYEQLRELLNNPEWRAKYSDFAEEFVRRESARYSAAMLDRAGFYGQLAQRESKRLRGQEQLDVLATLNEQFPHIFEAIDYALTQEDASLLAQFASRIAFPLLMQGKLELGANVYEKLLKQAVLTDNRLLKIASGMQYGQFLTEAGKQPEAYEILTNALETARLDGNESTLAEILICLGNATPSEGQYREQTTHFKQALELARKLGDQSLICTALSRLGIIAFSQSRLEDAKQLYTESLELARETGHIFRIAGDLHNMANVVQAQGDYRQAHSLFEEALELNRLIGNRIYETRNLMGLARIAFQQGRFREAQQLFSSAQSIAVETGKQVDYVDCERGLGWAAAAMENYEEARRHYETGAQVERSRGIQVDNSTFQRSRGALYLDLGQYQAAEAMFLEAIKMSTDRGASHNTSFDSASLGLIALETGRLPAAVDYLTQALHLASEAGRLYQIVEVLQAGVQVLARADEAGAARLLGYGVTQHLKRLGLGYSRKWHRDLDAAIAKCDSVLEAEQLQQLGERGASMSLEEFTNYALQALTELQAELD